MRLYSEKLRKFLKENGIRIGDEVELTKSGKIYNGVVMPRSILGDTDCLVLKLDNGYNIGLTVGGSDGVKKTGTVSAQKQRLNPVKHDQGKPVISILHTGGTIASRVDYRTGGVVAAFSPEDLLAMFPELREIANIRTRLVFSIMSESMRFSNYQTLAMEIAKEIEAGVDGVIVAHGTDTMHYTAAALAFMLHNLPVPVILVGAQRSSDRGSTDAAQNLPSAAFFIARSDFADVAICMHEGTSDTACLILPACKSRKMHTSRRDAFRPINARPWARVDHYGERIEFLTGDYVKKDKKRKLEMKTRMEEKVALIKTTTNMDPSLIDFFAGKKYKGLVVEGTGLGHAPDVLLGPLKKAIESGMVVCMTSQTIYGRVNMNVYSPQRDMLKIGVIPCGDMLPETAFVKLAWLLGNYAKDEARELIGKNLRGEISERIEADEFLS